MEDIWKMMSYGTILKACRICYDRNQNPIKQAINLKPIKAFMTKFMDFAFHPTWFFSHNIKDCVHVLC
ncbi:CLUMA_CG018626, isoform A [Clunio marinus]|uniref:CLUMA_CG018626, isoform A n=1 Tax=Clunio marinus TaxID=568069 RepID=A0A1J1IZL5_9DIPT|nr:CLUMA_CG018626, isoform A [Clunio marinus]